MLSERYALGIDIGGTHFRMGLIDEGGVLSGYEKYSTEILSGERPIRLLQETIASYMRRYGVENRVVGVCIGFPATVDKSRETVLSAPNLSGFDGVPVGRLLKERLGLPVWIERDVNLLLLNDLRQLDVKSEDVIACYVGTGIGNAIMLGGKLFVGHNGVAGELGHIPFGDSQQQCGCCNVGCAEPLVGGLYLAQLAQRLPDTAVDELFLKHAAAPELQTYIERLGRVIAIEVNIIDPEALLLGGGVIGMAGFPKAELEKSILAHARKPLPHDALKILYSPATDGTGGVVGAGLLVWRKQSQ